MEPEKRDYFEPYEIEDERETELSDLVKEMTCSMTEREAVLNLLIVIQDFAYTRDSIDSDTISMLVSILREYSSNMQLDERVTLNAEIDSLMEI